MVSSSQRPTTRRLCRRTQRVMPVTDMPSVPRETCGFPLMLEVVAPNGGRSRRRTGQRAAAAETIGSSGTRRYGETARASHGPPGGCNVARPAEVDDRRRQSHERASRQSAPLGSGPFPAANLCCSLADYLVLQHVHAIDQRVGAQAWNCRLLAGNSPARLPGSQSDGVEGRLGLQAGTAPGASPQVPGRRSIGRRRSRAWRGRRSSGSPR